MTWDAFHRRGEVLRNVLDHADRHRDGALPLGMPGVAETFGDELTLLGALQLRWHTRLSGAIERELMEPSVDLETAVIRGWRAAARDLTGVRMILDNAATAPTSDDVAQALDKARRKEWTLLAAMAGKASPSDRAAVRIGRALEEQARLTYRPGPPGSPSGPDRGRRRVDVAGRSSVLGRVKAALAA